MKQIVLAAFVLLIFSIKSIAQCDKDVTLTSSNTEYLDQNGGVREARDEKTLISITGTTITISPASDHTMTGSILSDSCHWTNPYREGRSELKTTLEDHLRRPP